MSTWKRYFNPCQQVTPNFQSSCWLLLKQVSVKTKLVIVDRYIYLSHFNHAISLLISSYLLKITVQKLCLAAFSANGSIIKFWNWISFLSFTGLQTSRGSSRYNSDWSSDSWGGTGGIADGARLVVFQEPAPTVFARLQLVFGRSCTKWYSFYCMRQNIHLHSPKVNSHENKIGTDSLKKIGQIG